MTTELLRCAAGDRIIVEAAVSKLPEFSRASHVSG
jgi:hypothetical protein